MLFRWLRNEASPEVVVLDPAAGHMLAGPMDVDWGGFSLESALQAAATVEGATSHIRRRPG